MNRIDCFLVWCEYQQLSAKKKTFYWSLGDAHLPLYRSYFAQSVRYSAAVIAGWGLYFGTSIVGRPITTTSETLPLIVRWSFILQPLLICPIEPKPFLSVRSLVHARVCNCFRPIGKTGEVASLLSPLVLRQCIFFRQCPLHPALLRDKISKNIWM